MNSRLLITTLLVLSTVQAIRAGGWSWPPEKTFTLSKISKEPGVRVTVDTLSKPDDFDLSFVGYTATRPVKKVTMLLFPEAAFFSPLFFKNLRGFEHLGGHSVVFPSGFKVYLVVLGPDKSVFSCTSLMYETVSDGDDPKTHIRIMFSIAADLMEHSYLLLNEEFPRSGGQLIPVYFGARP